jgi:hypothetical protein
MFDKHWYDYDDCTDIKKLIEEAKKNSRTEYVWLCHRAVDYSAFNWRYLPNRHQKHFMHAWASHDNLDCLTTWLVPINQEFDNTEKVLHSGLLPILHQPNGKLWQWKKDPLIDYSSFNFNWFPSVWDWAYNHEFTMLGKERLSYTTLSRNSKNIKYHAANLTYDGLHYDICCIDTSTHPLPTHDYKVRLITTMEEALKLALKRATKPWLWVVCDVCDYDDFDFTWLPEEGEEHQIHCWPSGTCEKGDTFLIHIPTYIGEWNPSYNFNHDPVKRKRWTVYNVSENCLAWDLNNSPRNKSIYTLYSFTGVIDYPDVCLWEKRPVVSLNRSNSSCLVPRDCIVEKEIYEYPYLLRYPEYGFDIPVDVIFIHNDESCAEENWIKLKTLCPKAKILSGVSGRLKAYKTAAIRSDTIWFIAVFAKCNMKENFKDLNWQPDFWQEPKHYIFHNHNLNTGLIYGHMAPIAYHAKLLHKNTGGLDMTLAQRHTTVPITISETNLEDDPWLIWRTAFREVIKILHYSKNNPSIENEYRLWSWRNIAKGKDSLYQQKAVNHAEEYYAACGDSEEALMLTSEWDWLYEHFLRLTVNP